MHYVLIDTGTGNDIPLGVFDSPDIKDSVIAGYFGNDFKALEFRDIRDSGLEWQKIIYSCGELHTLTLHYFTLNEI